MGAYPFILPNRDAVAIIDGKGHAWVIYNYLDMVRADLPADAVSYTVLDFGGGPT